VCKSVCLRERERERERKRMICTFARFQIKLTLDQSFSRPNQDEGKGETMISIFKPFSVKQDLFKYNFQVIFLCQN